MRYSELQNCYLSVSDASIYGSKLINWGCISLLLHCSEEFYKHIFCYNIVLKSLICIIFCYNIVLKSLPSILFCYNIVLKSLPSIIFCCNIVLKSLPSIVFCYNIVLKSLISIMSCSATLLNTLRWAHLYSCTITSVYIHKCSLGHNTGWSVVVFIDTKYSKHSGNVIIIIIISTMVVL